MFNIIQAFIDAPITAEVNYNDVIVVVAGCLTIVFTVVMIDLVRDVFRRFLR